MADMVMRQIVVLFYMGSNPISHLGCWKGVAPQPTEINPVKILIYMADRLKEAQDMTLPVM